jgi:hypothetical protein
MTAPKKDIVAYEWNASSEWLNSDPLNPSNSHPSTIQRGRAATVLGSCDSP